MNKTTESTLNTIVHIQDTSEGFNVVSRETGHSYSFILFESLSLYSCQEKIKEIFNSLDKTIFDVIHYNPNTARSYLKVIGKQINCMNK